MACIVTLLTYPSVALVGCQDVSVVDESQVQVVEEPTPSVVADPSVAVNKNPTVICEPCPQGTFGDKTATLVPNGDLTPLEWSLVGVGPDHYTAIDNGVDTFDTEHIISIATPDAVEKFSMEDAPADLVTCTAIKLRLRSRWFGNAFFHQIRYTLRTDADTTVIGTGVIDLQAELGGTPPIGATGNVEVDITGLSLTKTQVDDITAEFIAEHEELLLQRIYIYEAELVLTYGS